MKSNMIIAGASMSLQNHVCVIVKNISNGLAGSKGIVPVMASVFIPLEQPLITEMFGKFEFFKGNHTLISQNIANFDWFI